ncbi:uncharacterized protein LOC135224350 [Macrobrachium nipponense]|uniref:uncharacterized protein LOC135224350 n=1 Tax=Macrobrachium nipponense TaxID=159736 RepID=UPI0030C89BAA
MDRTEYHQPGQQQQQQPAPAVVIVQQPVVLGSGTLAPRGIPFLRRGLKLNNGTKIGPSCIICLGVTGGVLTLIGIPLSSGISVFTGILFLLLGGGLLAVCFKFCQKAKQDYDALPQDHPDRIKYSALIYTPRRGGGNIMPIVTNSTCQFLPGAQVISSSASFQGGQVLANCQLPPGFQVVDSSSGGQNEGPCHGNIRLSQYPVAMSAMPQSTVSPEDDKPPSYEEVCRDMAHR